MERGPRIEPSLETVSLFFTEMIATRRFFQGMHTVILNAVIILLFYTRIPQIRKTQVFRQSLF